MVSLIVHAVLGVVTTALMVRWNARLFRRAADDRDAGGGSAITPLEVVIGAFGLASVVLGWYFNIRYIQQYGREASWVHFTQSLFTNWASNSAAQDYIIANLVLFPLWTIVDGRRRGIARPWIFFVMSLFTSYCFAIAAYLVAVERQVRADRPAHEPAAAPA
jgi:SNF family Na+-dependent transporter